MARAVDLSALAKPAASPATGRDDGSYVVDVTDTSFQAEVIDASARVPVVLDLWADWCQPCKALSPILEKLAAEGRGAWVLARVDVDANRAIASALQAQSIPLVVAVYQGRPVAEFTGAQPEAQVRQWIDALMKAVGGALSDPGTDEPDAAPPTEDPRFEAAETAVGEGDFDAAQTALDGILTDDPGNADATRMRASLVILRRAAGTTPGEEGSVQSGLTAADAEFSAGQPEAAIDRLLALVRATSGEERDAARARLVEIFAALGDDDPAVAPARRALSAALF